MIYTSSFMRRLFLLVALTLGVATGYTRVQLPGLYTSHMVLQQRADITLKGDARKNKTITFTPSWSDTTITTKSDADGHFTLHFTTPQAGGPYTLRFSDGQVTTLEDVYVGEVWLGSGQSNMEMPLAGWGKILNYQQEIDSANYPMIRLYQVQRATPVNPTTQVRSTLGGWQPCSPTSVPEFSALGYRFALELYRHLNIPIGIINSSWGGTPAETWVSHEAIRQVVGFQEETAIAESLNYDSTALRQRYDRLYQQWMDSVRMADLGTQGWERVDADDASWGEMYLPDNFDRAELPYFDGVVWYRTHITIPASWAKKPITLHLAAIDDEDITFINGRQFTKGTGWDQHRCYHVPAGWFHAGDNVLTVRVFDKGGNGGIWGAPKDLSIVCGKDSVNLAGTWKYRVGCTLADMPQEPQSPFAPPYPGCLYCGMIAPLTDFPIAGVIWYQGCNNVGRAEQYKALFPTLIADWRKQFHNPDMPFYFVQLANYLTPQDLQPASEWAALREAQDAALALPNTYRMVNIDLGEAYDIHPKNKQEVARRLALLTLRHTYQQSVDCTAPEYAGYRIVGNHVLIDLQYPDGAAPLVNQDNVSGFIILGSDGQWRIAQAKCHEGQIEVWNDEVEFPVAVRYGWADNPTCTLQTADGLHLAPFRTDK